MTKNTKDYYSDEFFCCSNTVNSQTRWPESPGKSLLYRPFLPLVFSTLGSFYIWSSSLCSNSTFVLSTFGLSTISISTFGLSTFGHSTFGHFLPSVILCSVILHSVFLPSAILRSVTVSKKPIKQHVPNLPHLQKLATLWQICPSKQLLNVVH
jgi:hypothetical protein